MGGRGSFAQGGTRKRQFITVKTIYGVPVLESNGKSTQHGLPMECDTHREYLKLRSNGKFHELRVYGPDHCVETEISWHPEKSLTGNKTDKVLHYHKYIYKENGSFIRTKAVRLEPGDKLFEKYKELFLGVSLND